MKIGIDLHSDYYRGGVAIPIQWANRLMTPEEIEIIDGRDDLYDQLLGIDKKRDDSGAVILNSHGMPKYVTGRGLNQKGRRVGKDKALAFVYALFASSVVGVTPAGRERSPFVFSVRNQL